MAEYHTRKQLRLPDYDYTGGCVCFVTICAKDRKQLFGRVIPGATEADCAAVILSKIGKTIEKTIKTVPGIDQYVIMPNHVHMIVFNGPGENISKKVMSLKALSTKAVGFSVWQRSFYDHVIRNEADYRSVWEYIETNPVKWMLDQSYC